MAFDTKFNRTDRTLKPGFARFMSRCPKKGCKCTKAHDVPMKEEKWKRGSPGLPDVSYTARFPDKSHLPAAICPEHGLHMAWIEVQGTQSDARKCDPRCTAAIGPICVCACAGANHGASWL